MNLVMMRKKIKKNVNNYYNKVKINNKKRTKQNKKDYDKLMSKFIIKKFPNYQIK